MTTRERGETRTVFGHPIGLTNLFGVELWERFSFYGMLTILGYYLYYSVTDGGLGLPQSTATGIVGAYGGLVYLSTVLGGWIADRLLGMERTVFYGGVVVMIGHIALAVLPGLTGVGVGLVCVALGSGALKANASSLLGTLYEKGDPRADGGFTLFYLGINLGAFIGPLITGLLQTRIGFHWGFGAAAGGLVPDFPLVKGPPAHGTAAGQLVGIAGHGGMWHEVSRTFFGNWQRNSAGRCGPTPALGGIHAESRRFRAARVVGLRRRAGGVQEGGGRSR